MISRFAPIQLLIALLYLITQVLLGSQLHLFDTAFCFMYVGFLLMLPFETGPIVGMVMGFSLGLGVDLFYDTLGINAIASLVLMYLRPAIVNLLMPQGGLEAGTTPSLRMMGGSWYLRYTLVLLLVHHLVLFYLEAFTFRFFFRTLLSVFSSVLITFATLVIIQLTFYRKLRP